MPAIFEDIYFLKTNTLSYLMQLVSTLTAGSLSFHTMFNMLLAFSNAKCNKNHQNVWQKPFDFRVIGL